MSRHPVLASALCALLIGCGLTKPDPAADAFGRQLIHFTTTGDSAGIIGSLDSTLVATTPWSAIKAVSDSLAALQPDSTALIGWNIDLTPGAYQANLTYELHGKGWALVTMVLRRRDSTLRADGFHFERSTGSMSELNAFTLAGRGWRHFLVLGIAASCVLICLVSATLVMRTPMPRRWIWVFVAVIGVGQVTLDWATGDWTFRTLQLELFGAGAFRMGLVGPWTVSFALPLGAAWALWRRRQFLARQAIPSQADAAA
jgi:hypothetical protein